MHRLVADLSGWRVGNCAICAHRQGRLPRRAARSDRRSVHAASEMAKYRQIDRNSITSLMRPGKASDKPSDYALRLLRPAPDRARPAYGALEAVEHLTRVTHCGQALHGLPLMSVSGAATWQSMGIGY